jgi:tRNA pseudouridine38-40 synthase
VVGKGEQKPAWVEEILAGRDRTLAGITAPAQGLYFLKVNYPAQYEFPDSTQGFEFFSS